MLIEFSVSNFRSFREQQTFQMTAAPRLGKKGNTFTTGILGEKLPALLKVAAVYGGNATGKSSLVMALGVIGRLIRRRPEAVDRLLPVSPFRFDSELLDKPSTFEVHFIADDMRYEFRLSATQHRITEEVLIAYPRGKETLLYSRRHVNEGDDYSFGDAFEGDEILRVAWRRLTGPKSLFIAQAVANSSEDLRQLRKPFTWLETGMFVLNGDTHLPSIGRKIPSDKKFSAGISSFLQDVDVPVTDIVFEPAKNGKESGVDDDSPEFNEKKFLEAKGKTTLTHETRLGVAKFDFSEESSGTQNLIGFWLPWQLLATERKTPEKYGILVVDELDSSLHPEIVEHLVSKQIESDSKTQLIFTTHDTHLMSTKLLRRDQFWLTDRNSNGATRLRSIHSIEGRESEDVEKRYYEGRYRGLPIRRGK
jgi:AAA15 family ATPase/GTPase